MDKYQKKSRKYVSLCFCAFRILLFLKFKPFYNISTGVLNFFDKTLQRSWKPLKFASPGAWNQNTADKNVINSWIDPFRMESNKMSAMMNLRVQRSRWGKESESLIVFYFAGNEAFALIKMFSWQGTDEKWTSSHHNWWMLSLHVSTGVPRVQCCLLVVLPSTHLTRLENYS